ncbi:SDR family NAD(P)-dependent oxidoreductase [Pseudonocardia sp. KRD291]|uniref:SDR family NAD(P)-dependent oxidoreductase n=1 Tax=Pseudonocardia sp. KRD291 TaxID=2792007 RepID=UPI001C49F6BD|nr:SDR family NAD(P)-dependent oxidoreductase [Pseudonocardia sp. KRD291]MBW0101325.1 SDR family NAD(P)-dependent oxidoreductase [Pseudonocardia sp. KRD291]
MTDSTTAPTTASRVASTVDTVLDRSLVLGYGRPGLALRRLLPGWPADPPRMDGKVVLVTGAGSGLGLAAAAGFARLGASVRALGRDDGRATEAADAARAAAGGGDVRPVACDVSSVAALRAIVGRVHEQEERLDVLVNNAGVMPDERTHSVDGVELAFATHVVAPWVLTEGLAPLMGRTAPARVINVTSGGQYGQRVPDGDVESARDDYGPKKIYARTKRALLDITAYQAQRFGPEVHVHAMHPGWADTKGVRSWMPVFRALTRPVIRTPEEGADTIVWLGGAPEGVTSTGLLWHDRRPRPVTYAAGPGADAESVRRQVREHVEAVLARHGGG